MRDILTGALVFLGILGIVFMMSGIYYAVSVQNQPISPEVHSFLGQTSVWVQYEWEGFDAHGEHISGATTGSGVIIGNYDVWLDVYTSRHVIDCLYTGECATKTKETIRVRTQDGVQHTVERKEISPGRLDVAILHSRRANNENYPSVQAIDSRNYEGRVIAVGYPQYADGVVEFSIDRGDILQRKELITETGIGFTSIESTAYTFSGSSGGGLFSESGQLLGISTWAGRGLSTAITTESLPPRGSYLRCDQDEYAFDDKRCAPYCNIDEVLDEDLNCVKPCKEFHCNSEAPPTTDFECAEGYVKDTEGTCLPACGGRYFCADADAWCFKDKCTTCPDGMYLYQDGKCYD